VVLFIFDNFVSSVWVLGAVHCFTNVENMTAEYWIMISHLVVGSLPEILHL